LAGVALVVAVQVLLVHSSLADRIAVPLLRPDTRGPAEVIVVLGAAVDPFCVPNLPAIRRTVLAVRLLRDGRAPTLLFSGGKTEEGSTCPVAQVMADFAHEMGVPVDRMLVETESSNTWENAQNCSRLLRQRGYRRILLVTDAIHMRRAELCFKRLGFETERASVPALQLYSDNLHLFRAAVHEYLGLWYYRYKGRVEGG
jgi:uncharacterized SAM-binding protein YcdF (DUF218 family)